MRTRRVLHFSSRNRTEYILFTLGNVQVACHLRERFVHRLPRGFELAAVRVSRHKKIVSERPCELTWTDAARFRCTIEEARNEDR